MNFKWKDIAVFLDGTRAGEKIGRHAAAVAQVHRAHLVGVYGISHPEPIAPVESFARGEEAVRKVLGRMRKANEEKTIAAGLSFAELVRAFGVSSEFRVVWRDQENEDAALKGLHSDLIVAAHPIPTDLPAKWSGQHLLLASGAPVLLVPEIWCGETIGGNVVVAWNGSREARRAVNDAMPFLTSASHVTALIVDDGRMSDEAPGTDLQRHLQRHDVKVELRVETTSGGPVAQTIQSVCHDLQADLLVFGAYSRPRTAEMLFGGVTRTLLAEAGLPLLMSR